MKIFAIQKTQTNTYSPKYQQNSSINQNPVTKTNLTGDKFVSKIAFGMASINDMKETLAELQNQLNTKQLSKIVREELENQISKLKLKIQRRTPSDGDGISSSAAQRAIDNYMP